MPWHTRRMNGRGGIREPIYDWYVDSVGGDNGNIGTSKTQALKTISALLGKNIVAEQKIGLGRGSNFRETLTVPVSGLTFAAYGNGSAPIINGSDIFSGWTAVPTPDFADSFEDGTINAWAATTSNGTVTGSTAQHFDGSYSAKCVTTVNNGTAYIQKATAVNVGTGGHIWLTGRFYPDAGFAGNNTVFFLSLMETGGDYKSIKCGISATGAFYVFNGVSTDDWTSTITYTPDAWFSARLYIYVHDTAGIIRLWINDDLVVEATGQDTLSGTNWRRFSVGIVGAANDTPTLYVDYCRANGSAIDPSVPVGYYKTGITTQVNCGAFNGARLTPSLVPYYADAYYGPPAYHLYEGANRIGYDDMTDICYIRCPADANPLTGTVELGQRDQCITATNKSNLKFQNIVTEMGNDWDAGGVLITGGSNNQFINSPANRCADTGIMFSGSTSPLVSGGTFTDDQRKCVEFYSNSDNGLMTGLVGIGTIEPTLGPFYIRSSDNCIIEYCTGQDTMGFCADINGGENNIERNNRAISTEDAFTIEGLAVDYEVANNYMENTYNPNDINFGTISVSGVAGACTGSIHDNELVDSQNGIYLNGDNASGGEVYRNLIRASKATSTRADLADHKGHDVHFYNNTSVNAGEDGIELTSDGGVYTDDVKVKNNIIYNPTGYCLNVSAGNRFNAVGMEIDYNCYWKDGADPDMWKWGATVYKKSEFDDYKTASGQDANSIVADPLFVSATDFHLQTGSPCINAGTDVSLPYLGAKPDMGYAEKA